MATTENYKGLTIITPDPTGDGGLLLLNNFKTVADTLETKASSENASFTGSFTIPDISIEEGLITFSGALQIGTPGLGSIILIEESGPQITFYGTFIADGLIINGSTLSFQKGAVFDGSNCTQGKKVNTISTLGGTVTSATIVGDISGSASVTVKKYTISEYNSGSSGTTMGTLVLSSTKASETTNFSGWNSVAISSQNILEFTIDSVSSISNLAITLNVKV